MGPTYHQLYYHLIWSTFKRHELIDGEIEIDLERLFIDKIIENKSELICFGCTTDHIHLLVRLHPSVSISGIVGEVKGYSSYVISNHNHPNSGFRWQGGYGALTVSRWDISGLIRYIDNQKEYHANKTINQKWELSGL